MLYSLKVLAEKTLIVPMGKRATTVMYGGMEYVQVLLLYNIFFTP